LLVIASSNADPAVLQALAPAIDRAPLANVLAQHKAEAAFGVLPQWLSGYAFLFESPLDANRARQLASELHSGAVALSYPPNDLFLRSVAERVALNARDAGIAIQPTPNANGQLRLVQIPLESADAAQELKRIAEQLGAGEGTNQLDPAKPETLYQFERSLLDAHRILPLVHLRETFGIAPRVHFQAPAEGGPGGRPMGGTVGGPLGGPVGGPLGGSVGGPAGSFALHLEDAWLDPRVMP
jgi:hypothetical protein